MIEARGLSKRYGDVRALDAVDFSAADGHITGLLGPNGAGKSTALRILCTVLRADHGSATVDGVDVYEEPLAVRNRIGVLPHNANLYANLTARENIAYYAALQGLGPHRRAEAVAEVIAMLDIEDIADRRAKGFSQGQRVRVALARALVQDRKSVV